MKKICITLLSAIGCTCLSAQDFHYSMFTMAPLTLNPALTGNYTGDIRVVNNYRMQWSTVSKPYSTYSLGADMPLKKHDKRKSSADFFAVGLGANVDKAGSTNLKNNQLSGMFSYNKAMDGVGQTFFSVGFRMGLNQRSISMDNQSWDRQFNGLQYDSSLPNGELTATANDHYFYFDCGTGVAMTSVANPRFRISGGLFADHLNRPMIDFLGSNEKMYMKFGAHLSTQIALGANSNAWLLPQFLIVQQGPARMINAGLGVKYKFNERSHYTDYQSDKSFSIGGMYRAGDAVSGYLRVDVGPIGAAFNYDMNVSKLTVASKGMGALEFMLIYTGIYSNQNTRMSSPSFF